jgi:hypothetical protein
VTNDKIWSVLNLAKTFYNRPKTFLKMSKPILLSVLQKQFVSTKEYYAVSYALMPRTGTPVAYPGKADQDAIFTHLTYNKPGVEHIDFGRPEFYKSAKIWDCFKWLSGHELRGLFLSEKAAMVFAKFNLGKHRFYPFKAIHKETELDYCYLHIQSDETENVDFSASMFYYEDKQSDIFNKRVHPISFKSADEFKTKAHEIGNKGSYSINAVFAIDIKLNNYFDKELDIFTFADMQRKTIISARLKSAIEAQKLTGFDITEICVRT